MIYTPENTLQIGKPVIVFVDGVPAPHAFYADTETGMVKSYKTNEIGDYFFVSGNEVAETVTHGHVTVEPA